MPEEINRLVTDSISNHFFTTSVFANANLERAGVHSSRVHFVGNTMIDTLLANMDRFSPPEFWDAAGLERGNYMVVTLHRPANVDDPAKLSVLLEAIAKGAKGTKLVFPAHPRTAKVLSQAGLAPSNFLIVGPQPYLQFNWLVKHARAVITDSGGVTEETTVMGVPCITLRDTTERPETVSIGTNELIGTDPAALANPLEAITAGRWKKGAIPDLWDGRTSERIAKILDRLVGRPDARGAVELHSTRRHT
jgi:UDP-N-acetylglucosamine 2-epimerase (non-hydrolysing)